MVDPKLSPSRPGPAPARRRRVAPLLGALTFLLVAAFGAHTLTNAETELVLGTDGATQQPYTVSLVSQAMAEQPASDDDLSVADVAEAANAAVVTVYTFVDDGAFDSTFPKTEPGRGALPDSGTGDEPSPLGAGSGWILTDDGYVLTNAHVVQGATTFTVEFFDGTQVEAELIGTHAFQDVAVLKLDLEDGETLPGVSAVGDSAAVRPGDEVVAIGSPLGEFTNSVSDGNIGGLDRSLDVGDGTSLDNLIQHDAEISPGNSGGPLLNMRGEVIGMNVAKVETAGVNGATASGLNFAIDGNTVVEIAETIIANNGSIAFPYLGVQTRLSDEGTVVAVVEPDGPAAQSGIEAGDIIIGLDEITIDEDNGLMSLLLEHAPGDTVTLTVERADGSVDVDVTLGTRPDSV